MEYCLEMKDIQKQFLSLKALDNANLNVRKGEVHALLGINGAGKSTLIKVLSGVYKRDGGKILIDGAEVNINSPEDAIKAGVSTVYQDPQMIESYTGYENIYLGRESKKKSVFSIIDRKKLRSNAMELLKKYPLEIDLDKPVYLLSAIEREILAVLRALSTDCKLLILDEPTSILTKKEKQILFDVVRVLKEKGVSIIYITHHLDEVSEICDSITVFRNGKNIAEVKIENNYIDPSYVAELMLGKKLDSLYPQKTNAYKGEAVLEAKNISLNGKLNDVNFTANNGEILGIFGLVGSGIDELSKIVFGAMDKSNGEVYKNGEKVELTNPKKVINQGIFLVPGDRKKEGQIGNISIAKNITISKMKRVLGRSGFINKKSENKHANDMVKHLSIATTSIFKNVEQLSGGNQQKVVISKGLFTQAQVYIFSEPTVGVDVGAKFAIYETMRELSKNAAVIIISSDPEEVLGNADKVVVIQNGEVNFEKSAEEATVHEMLVHAVSGKVDAKGVNAG